MTQRVVAVVGGSSGIGLAVAERLAADGDRVVLAARSADGLAAAVERIRAAGGQAHSTVLDVREAGAVDRFVEGVRHEHGRLDALVHTATTMAYGRIEDLPGEIFDAVVDTAVHGTSNLARAVLPVFRRQDGGGVLVIVNSLLGAVTVPNMGAYACAKWGQRAVARTLQQETRDDPDVHVCIVSPGGTNTPIYYQAASRLDRVARPPVPVFQPTRPAAVIAGLIRHPRRHVSVAVGPTNPLIVFGYRVLPLVYDAIVGPLFRLGALTRERLGPTDGNVVDPRPADERVHGHWPDRPC